VELNSNLLVVEHKVQSKQIVDCHEGCGVNVAVTSQEGSKVFVGIIKLVVIIKFDYIIVLFSIKEFVSKVTIKAAFVFSISVPLWEMMLDKELSSLKWFIVN
jgi:hypothetical protein